MLHILTPFSRPENLQFYIDNLKDKNCIWYPILHEPIEFPVDDKIKPYIISDAPKEKIPRESLTPDGWPYNIHKLNDFIQHTNIIDDDRYLFMNDDDWFEDNVFEQFNSENDPEDDVCFISMKRGVGNLGTWNGSHGTYTLMVDLNRVIVGNIGFEQMCLKGRVLKSIQFENNGCFDGLMAMKLHAEYKIKPLPEVYALFNFLEKGRW